MQLLIVITVSTFPKNKIIFFNYIFLNIVSVVVQLCHKLNPFYIPNNNFLLTTTSYILYIYSPTNILSY